MVHYRRHRLEGGTFFFTVTLSDRRQRWLIEFIDDLRAAYRVAQAKKPFTTEAIVVLPEHIHAIWTLPLGDSDYSGRWRLIKSRFSRALLRSDRIKRTGSSRKLEVWQSRFWEHTIRDQMDLLRHVDYIHYNAVKHGHAKYAIDWPHSSFHRFVKRGDLPADWGGAPTDPANDGRFGE